MFACFFRQPLAEGFGRIVGHRNGRPVATTPTLIGNTERGSRSTDRIDSRIGTVVGKDLRWGDTSLGHRFSIERPIHIPSHLNLTDKERRQRHFTYRSLIILSERLIFGTTHQERTAWNRLHIKGDMRTGNLLRKTFETSNRRSGCKHLPSLGRLRHPFHTGMAIIGIIVPSIKVTTDTLQTEAFFVIFIIEVRFQPLVSDPRREKLLMALLTRLVIYNGLSVL